MPAVTPESGPVAVTGASGFVGSHVVQALVARGYAVRACVTDASNPGKVDHLLALNAAGHPGHVSIAQGNLLEPGSYDATFAGCAAVLHVGTAMGYGNANQPQEVYDGAVDGTRNVMGSVERAGSVQRFIYTSSFAAIAHPAPPGYVFTEADWASDGRENDPSWSLEDLNEKDQVGYAMAKVEAERMVYGIAQANGGFEAVSICPIVVLGPLMAKAHDLVFSWQWFLGRMLRGKPCIRAWQNLWNVVDVRDVAAAHVLAAESDAVANGERFQLSATDASGELDVLQLQAHLQALFPHIDVGGPPDAFDAFIEKHGSVFDAPRAHCDKARKVLGLKTHAIEDTLRDTGQSLLDLGFIEPALK